MKAPQSPRRRWLVPEVVQTSGMDCGPAVLKCLLEGFGIPTNYGRLREACQTDVDGTSVNTLEELANKLGLRAEQVMLPADHLLLPEAAALPAILIVALPDGSTHFILVWRRHGPLVQVMDPAVGRRWLSGRRLLDEAYIHRHTVSAAAWREWAATDGFLRPLGRRLRDLGLASDGTALLDRAAGDPDWRSLALLDAATRMTAALVSARGLKRGREARRALAALTEPDKTSEVLKTSEVFEPGSSPVPEAYWSVTPAPPGPDGLEQLVLQGVILVRIEGRREAAGDDSKLGPELSAALAEPGPQPARTLLRLLAGGSVFGALALAIALLLTAGGTVVEGLLLRSALDVGRDLTLVPQRLAAVVCLLCLGGVLLVLELRLFGGFTRLGRRLENRLRLLLGAKIPRMPDRYIHSRPNSDTAERAHSLQQIRLLPRLAGQFVRAGLTLALTALAIGWVDPTSAVLAAAAAASSMLLPLAFLPQLSELDLRLRTLNGVLSRFYLDVLLGLAPVRAHGAERVVRREHEGMLVEWVRAGERLLRWVVLVEGLQMLAGVGLAGWLVFQHASRVTDTAGVLLIAYWSLNIPILAEEIALLIRQFPTHRNLTLRLLEPLGSLEDTPAEDGKPGAPAAAGTDAGAALRFKAVTVRAAGHTILEDLDLDIPAGSQVAVVGASGAGKSTLVGLLLGWHRPAAGHVFVDGVLLDPERFRAETAWVDPAVQLWNRTLLENLLYGTAAEGAVDLGQVLEQGDLFGVLRRLPDGLQTPLGEGGGLVSGGEGQRVRFGRALTRRRPRLVILDEPFRGLDRAQRQELLRRARQRWAGATLLCVTHDVRETQDFERVLVVEGGRVVEDDAPRRLALQPDSRYRALLEAEEQVRSGLWEGDVWRRLWLEGGQVRENSAEGSP